MFAKSDTIFTVWNVQDMGNYMEVALNTGRKLKDTDYDKALITNGVVKEGSKYINTRWSFIRLTGEAFNRAKKHELKDGDRITNLELSFNQEPFFDKKINEVGYPKNIKITVLNFEFFSSEPQNGNMDTPPTVESISDDDCPF